jgi:putative membrane protein
MFTCLGFGLGFWWIFPVIMIAMMVFCFFMMKRGHMGPMMCMGSHKEDTSDQAPHILDKRYAQGEIGKQEYEEKKRDIMRRVKKDQNHKEASNDW